MTVSPGYGLARLKLQILRAQEDTRDRESLSGSLTCSSVASYQVPWIHPGYMTMRECRLRFRPCGCWSPADRTLLRTRSEMARQTGTGTRTRTLIWSLA